MTLGGHFQRRKWAWRAQAFLVSTQPVCPGRAQAGGLQSLVLEDHAMLLLQRREMADPEVGTPFMRAKHKCPYPNIKCPILDNIIGGKKGI